MSKAAKISIFLLIAVIAAFAAFSFLTLQQKNQVTSQKIELEKNLEAADSREIQHLRQIKDLSAKIKNAEAQNADLGKRLKEANLKSDQLNQEVASLSEDRDKWKRRLDKMTEERDQIKSSVDQVKSQISGLQDTIREKDRKLVQMEKEVEMAKDSQDEVAQTQTREVSRPTTQTTKRVMPQAVPEDMANDQYWAAILRQKAELEIQLGQLDDELAKKAIEVVDMKKENESLKIEIDELRSKSESLSDEIKYKSDLVNNLSLELARTKNDRKFVSEKLNKINEENAELRRDMRSLVSAKGALQKSIVKLTQDKNKVEKELGSTESMIQSKIDEIWEIKDSLDQTFQESAQTVPTSNDIELPPIHVSSQGSQVPYDLGSTMPGFNGRVVSINEENNFVIVDIGQSKGINLGEALSVYRDDKYIARLEVMQVRNDISAADVRDQWSRIQVGDIVR